MGRPRPEHEPHALTGVRTSIFRGVLKDATRIAYTVREEVCKGTGVLLPSEIRSKPLLTGLK